MMNVVRPAIRVFSARLTRASVAASSALVASSRIRIGGSFSRARAIASRCRWPPDRVDAALADLRVVTVRLADDELVRIGHAARTLHLFVRRIRVADTQVVADRRLNSRLSWNTTPIEARRLSRLTSRRS